MRPPDITMRPPDMPMPAMPACCCLLGWLGLNENHGSPSAVPNPLCVDPLCRTPPYVPAAASPAAVAREPRGEGPGSSPPAAASALR